MRKHAIGNRRFGTLVVGSLMAAGCSAAADAVVERSERETPVAPTAVKRVSADDFFHIHSLNPDEYVTTPQGLQHESCVHEVPSGANIDLDGNVWLDGQFVMHMDTCRYPPWRDERTQALAEQINGSAPSPSPQINTWILYDYVQGQANEWGYDWFNVVMGGWTVPRSPTQLRGVTYLFNGLWATNAVSILQPVLQFGDSGRRLSGEGPNVWGVASWYYRNDGTFAVSTFVPVSVGDYIFGETAAQVLGFSTIPAPTGATAARRSDGS
jgi:hypothetical protein